MFDIGVALRSRRPATGVSRALRARVFRGVSPRVSPKTGVSEGVSHGLSPGFFGPRAPECPKSVLRVFPECQKRCPRRSGDTLGTLFGHSGARGPKSPGDTPWDTRSDTPVFGDTLGDTPQDTRARRARETPVAGQ